MKFILLTFISWVLITSVALGQEVTNAQRLREVLLHGLNPVKLQSLAPERGCTHNECSIDIEQISILPEQGVIKRIDNKQIILEHYVSKKLKDLPEINWEPIRSFKVLIGKQRWGTCLEFSHVGIGSSGRFQRWQSVVLIPWQKDKPRLVAYHFIGYWTGCGFLAEGKKTNEILLSTIEPSIEKHSNLHIFRYQCNQAHCTNKLDSQIVKGYINSKTGSILFENP